MVGLARNWTTVREQHCCEIASRHASRCVIDNISFRYFTLSVETGGWFGVVKVCSSPPLGDRLPPSLVVMLANAKF